MKILVTGAKGFVGRNLVENLKNVRDGKNRTRSFSVEDIYEYDIDSKLRHIVCSGIDPLICLQFLSWESKIEVMYNNYGNFICGVFVNSDSQIKTDFSDVRKIFHIKTVYDFINRPIQTEKFDYKIEKGNQGHRLGDSFDTILMGFAQELVKEGVLKPEFWM